MIKNEVVAMIYSTKDYDAFKLVGVNREIKRGNVEKIKNSMQVKNIICPIIVNNNMEIIDGQHRYTAWLELGLPIYYYILNDVTYDEMITLNINKSNWALDDYLDYYVKIGNTEYVNFRNLQNEYGLNISDMILVLDTLSGTGAGENASAKKFKEGELDMSATDRLVEFLSDLRLFGESEMYLSTYFIRAFLKLYMSKFYDSSFMTKRALLSAVKIQQNKKGSGNIDEQCEFLAGIYMSKRDNVLIMYDRGTRAYYHIGNR